MSLPLFPLHTVLYPGCMLDLQIFEPRYLDMISQCLRREQGFGVVCILEGEEVGEAASHFAALGCEALIRDWQQRPNGLLGIRVEGGRRFRVNRAEVQADQSTLAEVDWLSEPVERPLQPEHADLLALLQTLGEHPMVAALEMPLQVQGQRALADRLAYLLPFSPEDKLQLLAMSEPGQRLERIQELLGELQE